MHRFARFASEVLWGNVAARQQSRDTGQTRQIRWSQGNCRSANEVWSDSREASGSARGHFTSINPIRWVRTWCYKQSFARSPLRRHRVFALLWLIYGRGYRKEKIRAARRKLVSWKSFGVARKSSRSICKRAEDSSKLSRLWVSGSSRTACQWIIPAGSNCNPKIFWAWSESSRDPLCENGGTLGLWRHCSIQVDLLSIFWEDECLFNTLVIFWALDLASSPKSHAIADWEGRRWIDTLFDISVSVGRQTVLTPDKLLLHIKSVQPAGG
mgnify:CR=1 FL=1